jgi:hypothetical protein
MDSMFTMASIKHKEKQKNVLAADVAQTVLRPFDETHNVRLSINYQDNRPELGIGDNLQILRSRP